LGFYVDFASVALLRYLWYVNSKSRDYNQNRGNKTLDSDGHSTAVDKHQNKTNALGNF